MDPIRVDPLRPNRRINTGLSTVGDLSQEQMRWSRKDFILQMSEDYLKAATLPPSMRTLPDGRDVSKLTFEEWLQEAAKTLRERIDELSKAVLLHGLKKSTMSAGTELCNLSIQAIDWFLALEPAQRDGILNENKMSNIERDPRSVDEIVGKVMRDLKRNERADQITHPLRPSEMTELLREAREKGDKL